MKGYHKQHGFTSIINNMNNIKQFEKLTYIETYDWEIRTTPVEMSIIWKLLQEVQFLPLGEELINKSNIKRVFTKEISDVDKVIYSIEDKNIRRKIMAEVEKRNKEWLRVNIDVVENLLSKYQ